MSEKLHHKNPERHHNPEKHDDRSAEHLKELQERAKHAESKSGDEIESIKKSIESNAVSGKEYSVGERETHPSHSYGVTKQLKRDAYRKTLHKAQTHLRGPEKAFSKVIHKPAVERVSDIGAKTVARPGGLLLGGITAFVASIVVLFIAKRSGFTYNYLLFLIVFAGGYLLGVVLEAIIGAFRKAE